MTTLNKRIHVVINPASGKDEPILNIINDVFQQHNIEWSVSVTQKYGDATEFVRQAANDGFDIVAGYGGDGTQHEIANGIMGTDALMGILPGGTGISITGLISKIDDGLVDIFILDGKDLRTLAGAADRMLNLNTKNARMSMRQGKEITIETDPDQPVWTDGEYTGRTPVSMKVLPAALAVIVP